MYDSTTSRLSGIFVAIIAFASDGRRATAAEPLDAHTVEGRVTEGFRLALRAKNQKLPVGEPIEVLIH